MKTFNKGTRRKQEVPSIPSEGPLAGDVASIALKTKQDLQRSLGKIPLRFWQVGVFAPDTCRQAGVTSQFLSITNFFNCNLNHLN